MFIPLHDANPLRHIEVPYVSRALIVVTASIFVVFQSGLIFDADEIAAIGFSLVPVEFLSPAGLRGPLAVVPEPLTFVTYLFLHGGWMHLIGNMLFLWVFGDNIEDAVGHAKFLAFYVLCGAAAGLAHTMAFPYSNVPLVGASGSVAGCLAAYVILHPRVKLWVLALGRIPIRITAIWAIGAWIVYQIVAAVLGADEGVSWWGHVGGLAAGAVLILILKRPEVPLFDRNLPA
jgi:membrane associated rhomboid family serine protease